MSRRRAPGEGSVHFRKDTGRYRAALVIGYNTQGNPRRLRKDFDSKAQADLWLSEQRVKFSRGELVTQNITVAEFAAEWLEIKRRERSRSTYEGYRDVVRRHILPILGGVRLNELKPVHVRRFVSELQKSRSPAMVARAYQYLSMILNEAVRLELAYRNVAAGVKVPKKPRNPQKRWSVEEVEKVLAWCEAHDHPVSRYVRLGLATGMRREELLGLRWQDVDISRGLLEVRQTVIYLSGEALIQDGAKNEGARRTLTFGPSAARALRQQQEYVEFAKASASRWQENDLVFPSTVGTPLPIKTLRRNFSKMIGETGVTPIRLYDLRSTHGSILAEQRVNPKAISERLGHADVRFTFNVYIRSNEEEQRKIDDLMEHLFQGQPGADGTKKGVTNQSESISGEEGLTVFAASSTTKQRKPN